MFVPNITLSCSPLPATSSAWLASSFMSICLSVLVTFFTIWLASLYCSYISLSLGLKDFLLQSSSVFNGFPGILCDPLLPLPLLCSKAGFAGLLVGYLQLLPLCVDVSRVFQRLVFSICQYLELILQLKYEGSLYFKVSTLLHVKVLPPAQTGYGIPQLQLQCCCQQVVVTTTSSSSSHSDV